MVNSAPPAGSRPGRRRVSRLLIGTLTVVLLLGATGVAVAAYRRWSAPDDPPCVPASARVRTELDGADTYGMAAFNADGNRILAVHNRDYVLLDPTTGRVVRRITNSSAFSTSAVSAEGRFVAAAGTPNELPVPVMVVWDTSTAKKVAELVEPDKIVPSAQAISRNGRQLATVTAAGVRLWDLRAGRITKTLNVGSGATEVVFSTDGKLLAAADVDGMLAVWDVATGERRKELDTGRHKVQRLRFSPDGKYVAILEDEGPVTAVELATGRRVDVVFDWGILADMQFSPDNSSIVTTASDASVIRTSLVDGKTMVKFRPCGFQASIGMIAPDGKSLVGLEKTADGTAHELISFRVV